MALPREALPAPTSALLRGLLDPARPADPRPDALREALRRSLGAPGVALLGSARVGLWRLFADLGRRHPGAEVLLWGYNFFAVPDMVRLAGLVPVFLDAAGTTGEPDLDAAERAVGPKTRGVLVSHHFGRPATLDAWTALAARHGLTLVEDCAHAFGARWGGRSVGLFGAGGVFSLSLTKGLVGGAGGVLVTADLAVAEALGAWEARLPLPGRGDVARTLVGALVGKVLFSNATYAALVHAPNRLASALERDPIEQLMIEPHGPPPADAASLERALSPAFAGVALAHLPSVDREVAAQRRAAEAIVGARTWRRLEMPPLEADREATWLNFVVRTADVPGLRRHLLKAGFDTRPDYIGPMGAAEGLPVAHRLARSGVYLPVRAVAAAGGDVSRLVAALEGFDDGHPRRRHGSSVGGSDA